ncbi:MAG: bacteriohemerythrin [Acidobacteriota bacterium]
MALLNWSEDYSVNVREIDDQHKKLIGYLNELNDAMRAGNGKEVLGGILKNLVAYTSSHFAAEERLMKSNGYPDYEAHKDKHEKMTRKVLDIQKAYIDGKIALTLEVMTFLHDWVDKHIKGTDKKYAPFLNAKGVK